MQRNNQYSENAPVKPYILVGTDLSDRVERSYPTIRDLSKKLNAGVHFLHAFTPEAAPSRSAAEQAQDRFGMSEPLHNANRDLKTAGRWFGEAGLDFSWSIDQVGTPTQALLRIAEQQTPELIVLVTDAKETLMDRLRGTVISDVLAEAPCPVLTMTPEQGEKGLDWQRVLLPVDFSEDSAKTTAWALQFLSPGTTVDLQYVIPDTFPVYHGARGLESDHYDFEQLKAGFDSDVERFWTRFGRDDLNLRAHIEQGEKEEVLAETAEDRDVDLLVTPVRSTGWFRDLGAKLANRPKNCAILSVPLSDMPETTDVRAPAELLKATGR